MLSVVETEAEPLPSRVTVGLVKVGVEAATIEGDGLSLIVMVPS